KAAESARTAAQSDANAKNAEIETLKQQLAAAQNEKTTFEGQAKVLDGENKRLDTENKSLKLALDGQRNIADLTSQESEERTKEAQVQRARNMELNKSRDTLVVDNNTLRDQLFGIELQLKQTEEKYNALLKTNATMRAFLASKDLPTDTRLMTVSAAPPPDVWGKIVSARREEKGNRVLVEVSLGLDDGLIVGHAMTVYRNDKYLGRIRLEDVRPDRSVGVVVETAPNSIIEVQDNVTTKF
ncbi:MAG: hypothetical protein B7Z55_09975, partial [Planctomycetales bacterium 12-60-4]